MILSLCLFLPALSPSSQETCSAPGALPAPIFYLKQTFPREGDAVLLQCSVFSRAPATRIIFCKDGEEISSQRGLEEKITYSYLHAVSRGSSGNYSCGYEIKESNNWVNRSQLSPAKYLSVTGHGGDEQSSTNSSGGGEEPTRTATQGSITLTTKYTTSASSSQWGLAGGCLERPFTSKFFPRAGSKAPVGNYNPCCCGSGCGTLSSGKERKCVHVSDHIISLPSSCISTDGPKGTSPAQHQQHS
nr:uncharacterized protein LOC101937808 isoform X3 [Chrysemys picta bellii]